jgi:ParB family chromosome partitioning protein
MQPLLVRRAPNDGELYEIIAGERRWRAAQMAGAHELPVVIHELSDRAALEVALLENVQRQDLSPLEEAEGYRRLIEEFDHTQEALASALGKSRSHIANLLRLLGLPAAVRALLERGELSAGHARALLGSRDPVALAKMVVSRGWNVRQTEAAVRADAQRPERRRSRHGAKDTNTRALERDLSSRLGLTVSLTPKGDRGTLQIAYHSLDQLDDLIRRLS